jgi:hypothetical protein
MAGDRGRFKRLYRAADRSFRERIRLNCPVTGRTRCRGRGYPQPAGIERFDKVVFACHSDQALQLLAAPSEAEQSILGALPYADNDVVLHTDTRLLPRENWRGPAGTIVGGAGHTHAAVTYDMNILQGIQSDTTFCVSLNQSAAINPFKVLAKYTYAHPQYSLAAVAAQARWAELTVSSTPITAAPTGPTVSMRTAWSAHCAWPPPLEKAVNSALYSGWIAHRRFAPTPTPSATASACCTWTWPNRTPCSACRRLPAAAALRRFHFANRLPESLYRQRHAPDRRRAPAGRQALGHSRKARSAC